MWVVGGGRRQWGRVQPDGWTAWKGEAEDQSGVQGVTQKVAVLLAPTVERKVPWAICQHSLQFNSKPTSCLALGKSSSFSGLWFEHLKMTYVGGAELDYLESFPA